MRVLVVGGAGYIGSQTVRSAMAIGLEHLWYSFCVGFLRRFFDVGFLA